MPAGLALPVVGISGNSYFTKRDYRICYSTGGRSVSGPPSFLPMCYSAGPVLIASGAQAESIWNYRWSDHICGCAGVERSSFLGFETSRLLVMSLFTCERD